MAEPDARSVERAARLNEAVGSWEPQDRRWWRELLDVAPKEALLVAEVSAAFDARPVDPETLS